MKPILLLLAVATACSPQDAANRVEPSRSLPAPRVARESAANPEGFRAECVAARLHRVMTHADPPRLLRRVEPNYPETARSSELAGVAIVAVAILASGEVCDARMLKGIHPEIDSAIREAIQRWRFAPATINGRPIAVVYNVTLDVDLRRQGGGAG